MTDNDWLDFLDDEEDDKPKSDSGSYVAMADGDLTARWDLGDFLNRLGGVFLLGRKEWKEPEWLYIPDFYFRILDIVAVVVWGPDRPKPVLTRAQLRRRRIWSYSLATASVVAFFALMVSVVPSRSEPLPPDLVGVWTTSAPAYANRTMEIAKDALVFQVGEGETDYQIHPITQVRHRGRVEDGSLYKIRYGNEEAPLELAFYYEPGPEPRIRFQNQADLVWRPQR